VPVRAVAQNQPQADSNDQRRISVHRSNSSTQFIPVRFSRLILLASLIDVS